MKTQEVASIVVVITNHQHGCSYIEKVRRESGLFLKEVRKTLKYVINYWFLWSFSVVSDEYDRGDDWKKDNFYSEESEAGEVVSEKVHCIVLVIQVHLGPLSRGAYYFAPL
jgi:hypothetical protein